MVAARYLLIDDLIFDHPNMLVSYQEVIEAPAFVLIPEAFLFHTEEGELLLLWVQMPESVNEVPFLQDLRERLSLLGCEASHLMLSCGIIDVNLLVSNVQVSCQDHRLAPFVLQRVHVGIEILVPLVHTVVQALQLLAGIGNIGDYQDKCLEFSSDHSSLPIMQLVPQIKLHIQGLQSCKQARP